MASRGFETCDTPYVFHLRTELDYVKDGVGITLFENESKAIRGTQSEEFYFDAI